MRGFGSASITNNSRAVAEFRGDGAALDRLLAEARVRCPCRYSTRTFGRLAAFGAINEPDWQDRNLPTESESGVLPHRLPMPRVSNWRGIQSQGVTRFL